ncbi:MAG: PadR family transcriptional regulator [Bryobacteraceae bacterium]|nr:PadR family transcriptional regulator [Bryobacteraceae bacterium]
MDGSKQESRDAAPLTPAVFHIALALAGEARHGYAIMQDVERQTGGAVRLGPGTLYGTLKRMLLDGLIEEAGERERRRYYRLTPAGRQAAKAEAQRLARLVREARLKKLLRADA